MTESRPKAIISDIHSNLEALVAVMAGIEKRGIKEVLCLGDIVGYGPNPRECIDLAKTFKVTILGNHDEAAIWSDQTESFNPVAKDAVDWTRKMLEDPTDGPRNTKRWDFLGELQRSYRENSELFVHGSPRRPVREYVFPEDVANRGKMEDIFGRVEHVCYIGHSHMPGIFTEDMSFKPPQEFFNVYEMDGKKVRDPQKITFVLDHYAPPSTIQQAENQKEMREFCRERLAAYKIPAKIELASGEQYSQRFKKMRRQEPGGSA